MTQSLQDLERDIEQSRAKLDLTIDRLQGKMSVSGVLDDMIGTARSGPYAPLFDRTLDTVKRNPVPVMLIAIGIGLLAHRLVRQSSGVRRRERLVADRGLVPEPALVVEPEDVRFYGSGASPVQTLDQLHDPRRNVNSRL